MPFTAAAAVLATSTGGSSPSGSGLSLIVPLLLFAAIGYLLLIRPARNRQKRLVESRAGLAPGVEVITTAGLIATVTEVRDEDLTLEIAPGVQAKFLKGAIARVVPPDVPVPDDETPPATAGDDTTEH